MAPGSSQLESTVDAVLGEDNEDTENVLLDDLFEGLLWHGADVCQRWLQIHDGCKPEVALIDFNPRNGSVA